ncbi:fasciclin domain-containing protein [Nonlabens marinus]|uniref:Secreted and surface protein containing fasciclin-like repeats n=1 Tax=Nonlabens marinus S1-08 TaxID=1454201 RepID=W8VPA3_9FLAO|nr:fasciclin domain-containing protein [Nonlabens marinus]BAO54355.1 secreted and surface protein containing fasciclin-like repeats [Nonlabens marinus S1-08]
MKFTQVLSFALIAGTLTLTSCKDEEKEQMEAEKLEMEQRTADSLAMEEEKMMERDAMAVTVGGAKMYPDMTIVENASKADNLTTLVAAVQAAGLVETLNSEGPFTVFAPTNDAFAALPAGTVDTLLKPENKETLSGILTYHVVSGNVDAASLIQMIEENNGKATLTTVNGGALTAAVVDGQVVLTDAKGGKSTVVIADVKQSNGVVHAVNAVLMPAK